MKHACIPSIRTCKRALQVRARLESNRIESDRIDSNRDTRTGVANACADGNERGLRGGLDGALVSPARGYLQRGEWSRT